MGFRLGIDALTGTILWRGILPYGPETSGSLDPGAMALDAKHPRFQGGKGTKEGSQLSRRRPEHPVIAAGLLEPSPAALWR